jgi:hypothetical protein
MPNIAPLGMHGTWSNGSTNSEKFTESLDHFIHHVKPTEDKKIQKSLMNP